MLLPGLHGDAACFDEARAARLRPQAIDAGVRYMDTAYPCHGEPSEPFLGRALGDG